MSSLETQRSARDMFLHEICSWTVFCPSTYKVIVRKFLSSLSWIKIRPWPRVERCKQRHTQHTSKPAHGSPIPQRTTQVQQASRCSMNPQHSPYSSSDVGGGERHPAPVIDDLYIRTARNWKTVIDLLIPRLPSTHSTNNKTVNFT